LWGFAQQPDPAQKVERLPKNYLGADGLNIAAAPLIQWGGFPFAIHVNSVSGERRGIQPNIR
jgi:hypothetical protein